VRLSLDANVLVYFVDVDAGERHTRALDLLSRAGGADCILTLQSLGEFFHVVTRKGKATPTEAATAVERLRAAFPIEAADPDILTTALPAVLQRGLPFWDAMLWATVQQAGCQVLLTEDFQDGQKLGAVTFVNPFDPRNAAVLDRALSPFGS
jgi:predicted nucleic acid-binding protein